MRKSRIVAPVLCQIAVALAATAAPAQCVAPPAWFPHSQTKEPTFDQPFTKNCDFHMWAWQEFLWLTQEIRPGHPRFLDFPRGDDLFTANQAPVARSLIPLNRELMLKPRTDKTDDPTHFGEIRQAGSKGILVDQKGRSVYYLSQVNDIYYMFIRSNGLHLPDVFKTKAPALSFPVHSVELKSSWLIVPDGEKAVGFFTTTSQVNPLKCKKGDANCKGDDVVVDFDRSIPATVALVGLHVVGAVQGHSEFIWATFEHKKNAPDLADHADPMGAEAVSGIDFTFYKANTRAMACNNSQPDKVALDTKSQVLTPSTNVYRQFEWGGGNTEDTANIKSLNQSVQAALLKENSVWANYDLRGGVWLPKPQVQLKPGILGSALTNRAVGSVSVANSTMETFDQKLKQNCFFCHDTAAQPLSTKSPGLPGSNLNLSHILVNGLLQRIEAEALQTTEK